MNKLIISAFAITLASAWTVGPALAQDKTKTETVKDKAVEIKDKVKDKAVEIKDKVKDKTVETKDKIKDKTTAAKDKVETKMDSSETKNAQQALRERGFDPGPIDGIHGPRTSAAVREFQKKENLTVTGQLDDATRAKLTMSSSKADTAPSASPSTSGPAPAASTPPASAPADPATQAPRMPPPPKK